MTLVLLGGGALVRRAARTVFTIIQYAYVITLLGLVLSFLGWRAFRLVVAPLLILFFMIPLPAVRAGESLGRFAIVVVANRACFSCDSSTSAFSSREMSSTLGGYKLQVAEACSGLRYLFPLMTLSFLMALFLQRSFLEENGAVFLQYPDHGDHEQPAGRHHWHYGGAWGIETAEVSCTSFRAG